MSTRIQFRRDTAAAWTAANPTLASGEIGLETDTHKFKMGDGATAWSTLAYAEGGTGAIDATSVVRGVVRLGNELGGTAENPTVVSGASHTHTAAQVSDSTVTGRALMTAATAAAGLDAIGAPAKTVVEGFKTHDGTAGGGTRPTGYFRVHWIGGTTRPTNMAAGDVWERDA